MENYNERLMELRQQIQRRKRLLILKETLKAQQEELESNVMELNRSRCKEQAEADKLKGHSLAALCYRLLGKHEEKLNKEEAEAYAATLRYNTTVKELEAVAAQLEQTKEELFRLQNCEARYEQLVQEKAEAIKRAQVPMNGEMQELEEKLAVIESRKKELMEAIGAGKSASGIAERILNQLNSAQTWGSIDCFTDSILVTMEKYSYLDDAQDMVEEMQEALRRFQAELGDVTIQTEFEVNVKGFLRFSDYFFDDILSDCLTMNRIGNARSQVESTKSQVERILGRLENMLAQLEGERKTYWEACAELITRTEL